MGWPNQAGSQNRESVDEDSREIARHKWLPKAFPWLLLGSPVLIDPVPDGGDHDHKNPSQESSQD